MTNKRESNIPRKLESGMHVVVWIKPEYYLFDSEKEAGITYEKWLPGKLSRVGNFHFVDINGVSISKIVSGLIIIRSTAYKHNGKSRIDKVNANKDKSREAAYKKEWRARRKALNSVANK